ncbi:MAG: HAMP domain-containing protein [Candidatus Hydrogenedentes bacterium]|nr:HAMP domain-containing protein [Candidatus Hydrogenedentota bacterium]
MRAPNATYPPVRWYNSLIVRVIALCVILVLCLFGSVSLVTVHYIHQVISDMEAQTLAMAGDVKLWMNENPEQSPDPEKLKGPLQKYGDVTVDIKQVDDNTQMKNVVSQFVEGGYLVTAYQIDYPGGKPVIITAQFHITPQTEIVRAFKNRYILAFTTGFLVTIVLMVVFIARTLRPLRELSDSCAQISEGNFVPVEAKNVSGEIRNLELTFNRMVSALQEKEVVEANLRQAQRLSALGSLAAGIAHDVRNPLNAIKLLSSHVLDTLNGDPDSAPAVKHVQTIRSEVDRLDEIVGGFLALAKERELQPEEIRIDALLEDCLRLVRQDAEARGVRLSSELRAGDTRLQVDPKQCTRAVLNVLINALEVCPRDGRVRLFSRVTETHCQIEIRDDGPGLTKEVAERVFDPYYTTKPTGTGLGLSITRGIIEEHGGSIELSCTPGQGCQALISLPLQSHTPLTVPKAT